MSTAYIDFASLKTSVRIEQVVALLGLTMKQKGDQWRGACTMCKAGGDRALAVNTTKQSYFCFATGKGGDVMAFAAHIRGVQQRGAAELLHAHFGNSAQLNSDTVPNRSPSPARAAQEGRREPLKALNYLEHTHQAVEALGISAATAKALEGGFASRGTMRGRVLFPIHSRDGVLIAYCGIATTEEQSPRYMFPSNFDPSSTVWNAHRIGAGELYLVRDILKAVSAIENGVENVVCFLTEAITPGQLEQLASLTDERKCETVELF